MEQKWNFVQQERNFVERERNSVGRECYFVVWKDKLAVPILRSIKPVKNNRYDNKTSVPR